VTRTIAVAVSGGRDSLLALALLLEEAQKTGDRVFALHARLVPGKDDVYAATVTGLESACASLGISLHVLDLRQRFGELVIEPFVAAYAQGVTPNPCARCNAVLKFGLLLDEAENLGATHIATGHYVRKVDDRLARGEDATRDQSYFLSLVPKARLDKAVFPLGAWHKKDVLPALEARDLLPPIKAESREICFVPDDDYPAFLQAVGKKLPGAGPIVLADGTQVGTHQGLWRHTVGQRRGLGIGWSEPLYVLEKDAAANALVVGPRTDLDADTCRVDRVNFLVPPKEWPERVLAKTRYRQGFLPAAWELEDGKLVLSFAEPTDRPAPGQVAAVYDSDGVVLAGGIIRSA
jgi:tRNA-specific 2-thiouridylase